MSSGYFDIEIVDGYSIRQLFELINKLVISSIPVILTEDAMFIRTSTVTDGKSYRRIIVNCTIRAEDILHYHVNPEIMKGNRENLVHLEDFKEEGLFKNVSKNHSVRISRDKPEEMQIITDGIPHTESKNVPSVLNPPSLKDFEDLIDEDANIHIPICDFIKFIKNISKASFNEVKFVVSKKGLEIKTLTAINSVAHSIYYGEKCDSHTNNKCKNCGEKYHNNATECPKCNCSNPYICDNEYSECKYHYTTYVDNKVIKGSFQKLNGICGRSIIKFSSCKNGYLKLSLKIGDFGTVDIYLIDEKERN